MTSPAGQGPTLVRIFKNQERVDFDFVNESEPLEEVSFDPSSEEHWAILKPSKYQNVEVLILHVRREGGEAALGYLQVRGVDTKIKRQIVQTVYELKPAAAKNDALSQPGSLIQ